MDIYLLILLGSVSIAIIGGLGAFIWQLILSRDKQLNETAQLNALEKESDVLESLRSQVANSRRYDAHYQVLRENREAIQYIDKKIDDLIKFKAERIRQYGAMVQEESSHIIHESGWVHRNIEIDFLRRELNIEIRKLDEELVLLQHQRSELWGDAYEFQTDLIQEETQKNQTLDKLYMKHTELLEKFYLGYASRVDAVNQSSIDAGASALRYSLFATADVISRLWGASQVHVASAENIPREILSRQAVREVQNGINSIASNTVVQGSQYGSDPGLITHVA